MTSEEKERQAILEVLKAETDAYLAKDYEAWASQWVQDETAQRWSHYHWSGIAIDRGFTKIGGEMRAAMAAFPDPVTNDIRIEDLVIRLGKDMAWASYDEISGETDDPFALGPLHKVLKILHKIDGVWKLACVSVLAANHMEDCPVVVTDSAGRVKFLNTRARTDLADHPCLGIANGHLRARSRKADKALQAAIARAGRLNNFMSQRAAMLTHETHGKLPVILGEDETGETAICWVIPQSGTVRITFNDATTLHQRLDMAQLIFRLSPAQGRLARLIVEGLDTRAAAERLGISANTARTQLARIFDKTGVRTQQALVRILISAAPAA